MVALEEVVVAIGGTAIAIVGSSIRTGVNLVPGAISTIEVVMAMVMAYSIVRKRVRTVKIGRNNKISSMKTETSLLTITTVKDLKVFVCLCSCVIHL